MALVRLRYRDVHEARTDRLFGWLGVRANGKTYTKQWEGGSVMVEDDRRLARFLERHPSLVRVAPDPKTSKNFVLVTLPSSPAAQAKRSRRGA